MGTVEDKIVEILRILFWHQMKKILAWKVKIQYRNNFTTFITNFDYFITFGSCSLVIVDVVFWNKYSIVNKKFSPRPFWVDFGYVVLQKFLLLLIPNLLLYQFFLGPTLQQPDYIKRKGLPDL